MSADPLAHWEAVYASKGENELSWSQESPAPSIEAIYRAGASRADRFIDIGGGSSRLALALLDRPFEDVTVLDLSAQALAAARARMDARSAQRIHWIAADVTNWEPERRYDVWHDRAAFHFLTQPEAREAYVARLRRALRPGGRVIIATFALDGPERCSGLAVVRYDGETLGAALGPAFVRLETRPHTHVTPWGAEQRFQFSAFRLTD